MNKIGIFYKNNQIERVEAADGEFKVDHHHRVLEFRGKNAIRIVPFENILAISIVHENDGIGTKCSGAKCPIQAPYDVEGCQNIWDCMFFTPKKDGAE